MGRTAWLALAAAFTAVPMSAMRAPQDPPAPTVLTAKPMTPAEAASKMTGTWKLNEELSPLPRAGSSAAAGAVPGANNRGRGGGASGRPQARERGFLDQQQELRVRALSRELTMRPQKLVITATAASATFTDEDSNERVVEITNKRSRMDLGTALLDAKAFWNGSALTIELESSEPPKLIEIFELAPSGRQLLVTIRTDDGGKARSGQLQGQLQRVYDRVDAR